MGMTTLTLGHDQCTHLFEAGAHEWLLTNGLGGYASGTVAQINTRRYHGWLMAALSPPTQRTLLVAKIDITAHYRGKDWPLYANEFADGSVTPRGFEHLQSFRIENGLLIWRFGLDDAVIEQQLHMSAGENTTCLTLRVLRSSQPIDFTLLPLCTYRDDHQQALGGWQPEVIDLRNGFEIRAFEGATPYRVYGSEMRFVRDPDWYWHFLHSMEHARGLDAREDLFRPGWLRVQLPPGQSTSAILTAQTVDQTVAADDLANSACHCVARHQASVGFLPENAPYWVEQLAQACDQFVVTRQQPEQESDQANAQTIIAGYPWFTDWGRDTMIALTGLALLPKRFEVAARILTTFAHFMSEGMLPNRFPDQGATPEYNTVDATLWFFEALGQYEGRSGDYALVEQLYPQLKEIIDWHQKGTRYGIRVDSTDGLLQAGEIGVQLT
jgi:predicted glycogen debranching enzyme